MRGDRPLVPFIVASPAGRMRREPHEMNEMELSCRVRTSRHPGVHPMRILLTADLHYKLRQYDWLIGAAPEFDAVAIAGDHVDAFLGVPGDVQIAALCATMQAVAK